MLIQLRLPGGFDAARTDQPWAQAWKVLARSADDDAIGDLPTLRARCRDLDRNAPLAAGAVTTMVTSVIGRGLRLRASVDREYLGLGDDAADAVERRLERVWRTWARGADVTGTTPFAAVQELALLAVLQSGDAVAVRRQRLGFLDLGVQLIEADRVETPPSRALDRRIVAGIETAADGRPVRFHVRTSYDHSLRPEERWSSVPAFGVLGERLALHLMRPRRIDQSRGVPFLAPTVRALKNLDRYADAELTAALVAALFTVFVRTRSGEGLGALEREDAAGDGDEIKLGSGTVVDLGTDDEVDFANPQRPNQQYGPFVESKLEEIGVALGIPFEVLIKKFGRSYSAAKASIELFWETVTTIRGWFAAAFCQPVYEWAVEAALAEGLLDLPGFYGDPLAREAWLGSEWIGPSRPPLDPYKEWAAEEKAIAITAKTHAEVTAERTGGDWDRKIRRLGAETRVRREAGLAADASADPALMGNPGGD